MSVLLALAGFPLLLLYAYLLLYWWPALGGPGPDACDPATMGGACWRPEQRTFWIVGATAAVPAAVCLVLTMRRVRYAGRWWPWPVAAVVLAVVAGWAIDRIP